MFGLIRVSAAALVIAGLAAQAMKSSASAPWTADAARGTPRLAAEPSAHDFDQILGTWAFTSKTRNPNIPPEFSGRWTWSRSGVDAIIEDDYRVVDPAGNQHFLGVTYRAFDATTKRWANAFVQPPGARWSIGEAWRDGNDIVEGPADSTKKSRARFVFVDADHFTWSYDVSQDGGKTWINDWVKADAHRIKQP